MTSELERRTARDAKRLVQYPIRVRKIKRLRRQITDLNRCIRGLRECNTRLFAKNRKMQSDLEQSHLFLDVGIACLLCFAVGFLLG